MGAVVDWAADTCDLHLRIDTMRNGMTSGGLRIDRNATAADAGVLARLMTLKLSLCRVPVGGAKTVAVPKRGVARADMIAEIGRALRPHLEAGYLLGEDLGTTAADVIEVYRAAGVDPVQLVRESHAAMGLDIGIPHDLRLDDLMNDEFAGSLAGSGVATSLATAAEIRGFDLNGAMVSVQGFGTVGLAACHAIRAAGAHIVTIVDSEGFVHHPAGLDPRSLTQNNGIIDRDALPAGTLRGDRDQWLSLPADIVVPASIAGAINADNVDEVPAQVAFVVEGANAPLTDDAEAVLEDRGVCVIPDFLANAGSAVAFGLLAAGQATLSGVGPAYLDCISDATRRCLDRADVGTLRAAAMAEAQDFMDHVDSPDPAHSA